METLVITSMLELELLGINSTVSDLHVGHCIIHLLFIVDYAAAFLAANPGSGPCTFMVDLSQAFIG